MTKAALDKVINNLRTLATELTDLAELEDKRDALKGEVSEATKHLAALTKQIVDAKAELDRYSPLITAKAEELMAIQSEVTATNAVLGPLTTKLADIKARIFS